MKKQDDLTTMSPRSTRRRLWLRSAAIVPVFGLIACGQDGGGGDAEADDFPSERIDIITAFAAGGANDALARMLAEATEEIDDAYDFTVDNVEGGGGSVGQTQGAQADADGYTLTLITPSIITNPMFNDVAFTHEDFEPVILLNNEPHYLLVGEDSPVSDYESFIEYAEDNPGSLTIGVSGAETSTAFTSRDFASELDIETTTVPHDGEADAILQAQGGHIDGVVTGGLTGAESAIEDGSLTPILVFADEQPDDDQDVPLASEAGVEAEHTSWRGIGVPAGTDEGIIDQLHEVFSEAIESDTYVDGSENQSLSVDYMGPDDFQDLIDETYETYSDQQD